MGVLGEQLQFLVENFKALFRNVVGHDVVDGNLHVFETGAIEALDAVGGEQISVGYHAGHGAAPADARDQRIEIRDAAEARRR